MGLRYRKFKQAIGDMFNNNPPLPCNNKRENGIPFIGKENHKSQDYIDIHTDFKAGDFTCMIEGWEYRCTKVSPGVSNGRYVKLPPLRFNDAAWARTTQCDCKKSQDVHIEIGMRADANEQIKKFLDESNYEYTSRFDRATYYEITDGDNSFKFKVDVGTSPFKKACVTCGTCLGWEMFVSVGHSSVFGKKDLKKVDMGKHLLYNVIMQHNARVRKEQIANEICQED